MGGAKLMGSVGSPLGRRPGSIIIYGPELNARRSSCALISLALEGSTLAEGFYTPPGPNDVEVY